MAHTWIGHDERAVIAARCWITPHAGLMALKKRQHLIPAPPLGSESDPVSVVMRLPPHIEVAVDRARSANHASARAGDDAIVSSGRWCVVIAPADALVEDGASEGRRDADHELRVRAACFQHQHAEPA